MQAKPVSASQVTMTQLVLPSHTNAMGSVFGGTIMSWIDIAAAIAAQRHSNKEVVTASIDKLDFVAPVYIGWVVNLKASVNFTSRTSMEVGIRVEAENPKTGEMFHTASAYTTFVALGSNGKPTQIPELELESEVDRRRFEAAKVRRQVRLEQKKSPK
ncbi:Acyl-CoA thioester hydrolase [Bdellovibrio bacteriovorus W]|nr:Acyl-CoA thioester hydrolase [Bdellovibrio bacteriovorus W]